jgi:hypothetical protein
MHCAISVDVSIDCFQHRRIHQWTRRQNTSPNVAHFDLELGNRVLPATAGLCNGSAAFLPVLGLWWLGPSEPSYTHLGLSLSGLLGLGLERGRVGSNFSEV